MFSMLGFIIVLAAFPISLFAQQADNVTCFGTQYTGLDVNHCRRALRNIVYDSNGRLDSYSSTVFTWHKTCVPGVPWYLRICDCCTDQCPKGPKEPTVCSSFNMMKNALFVSTSMTRQWLEATVLAIARTCRPSGGIRKYPDGTQAQVYRSTATNVYDVNQPVCRKRTCNFQPNDCLLALNQLSVDPKGNFMVQNAATPSSQATWGSCTGYKKADLPTDVASSFLRFSCKPPILLPFACKLTWSHCPEIGLPGLLTDNSPKYATALTQTSTRPSSPGSVYISGGTEGSNGDMLSMLGFIIVLAASPLSLFAQQTDNVTCFKTQYTGLDVNHCRRALQNIVYDSNGRLDSHSSTVFAWHKTCVINVQKVQQNQPTRQWLEATVLAIARTCRPSGGIRKYPDGTQAQVYRSTATNVYDVNQPVCRKRTCNFQPNDCLLALNQLSVDPKGNFMGQKAATPVSQATWGNCTTTDSSAFRISHPEVNSSFKRMLSQCGSHPGSVYISGGTEGSNGDVRLSTLGSKVLKIRLASLVAHLTSSARW
ncbi:hypothetical protein PSTT_07155, partial [Puccinia striiformis]